jgi:transcriptional regulator with XRE-family HTH domain
MNKKTKVEIGARLRAIREKSTLSQEQFAAKLGIVRSTYSRAERGECFLSVEGMQSLAKDLNVSINWLLLGQGEMFLSKATASEEILVFGKENSEVEELLLLMKRLPLFKYFVLQNFMRFKTDNSQLVIDALKPPTEAVA